MTRCMFASMPCKQRWINKSLRGAVEETRACGTDFGTSVATLESSQPSFVLFRDSNLFTAEDYFGVLMPALPLLQAELASGCVAVSRSGRLRVRKLPIGKSD